MSYDYQIELANKIIYNILNLNIEAAVLAATPGAGKTTISQIVIQKYINKYPNAKVLVLTHGQNLLKNQYIDSLNKPFIDIKFTFNDLKNLDKNNLPQVFVGIPQAMVDFPLNKIDLLIVDECHEFYLKPMVQSIIKKIKPSHQLLMTGSPSEFIKLKKMGKKYEMIYICGEELINYNVFSTVELDVVPIQENRNTNYTNDIKKMFSYAFNKNKNLSKIMIAVNNIKQAYEVSKYLESINRKVALSTFKNDKESDKIKDFKENKYDTLIVVQRGILGFSDNNITGVFDLRCSSDIDISNQLFSRVLRKHPDNIEKFYYRCGNRFTKDFNNQVIMLHKIKAMLRKSIFTQYDGENMKIKIGNTYV
jgi:superfamily II DNA or RNA helicase